MSHKKVLKNKNSQLKRLREFTERIGSENIRSLLANCSFEFVFCESSGVNTKFKDFSDEVADFIGTKFAHSLLSLELRACSSLTDMGIIDLCEGLSGIKQKRNGVSPPDELHRYQ